MMAIVSRRHRVNIIVVSLDSKELLIRLPFHKETCRSRSFFIHTRNKFDSASISLHYNCLTFRLAYHMGRRLCHQIDFEKWMKSAICSMITSVIDPEVCDIWMLHLKQTLDDFLSSKYFSFKKQRRWIYIQWPVTWSEKTIILRFARRIYITDIDIATEDKML